jgi:hypothetical protein
MDRVSGLSLGSSHLRVSPGRRPVDHCSAGRGPRSTILTETITGLKRWIPAQAPVGGPPCRAANGAAVLLPRTHSASSVIMRRLPGVPEPRDQSGDSRDHRWTACRGHTSTRRTIRAARHQNVSSICTNQTPLIARSSPSSAVGAHEGNHGQYFPTAPLAHARCVNAPCPNLFLGVGPGMTRLTRLCRTVGVGLAVTTATLAMTQVAHAQLPAVAVRDR